MLFHERQNHELLQTHMDMFAAAEYKNLCCEHFSANRMLQVCLEHTKITMQHVHYTVHNICSTHVWDKYPLRLQTRKHNVFTV